MSDIEQTGVVSDGQQAPESDSSGNDQQKDSVKYDTYRKLLSETKTVKAKNSELEAKLKAFEDEKSAAEEKRLSEQGEYKKLLEIERKKSSELEEKDKAREKQLLDGYKLNAVLEKLPGKIASNDYLSFVDLDSIAIDPDSGTVDESSVSQTVNKFLEQHSRLLITDKGSLPNDAPKGVSKPLSVDEWRKLPLSERKKRMNEVKD